MTDLPLDLPPYARPHHPDVQAVIDSSHAASDKVETVLARLAWSAGSGPTC